LTKRDCERTLSKGLETGIVFGDVHPATVAMVVHDQELLVIAEGSVPPTLPPGNAYGAELETCCAQRGGHQKKAQKSTAKEEEEDG
jgi:hypothetical protein